jgi:hypothetical protein
MALAGVFLLIALAVGFAWLLSVSPGQPPGSVRRNRLEAGAGRWLASVNDQSQPFQVLQDES